jgi:hypothetical protein
MALVVRIDVDRPYGKQGVLRHIASRLASDYYLPRMELMNYLAELKTILRMLNGSGNPAFVFFRKCTYPSNEVIELMESGGHQFGLHLENSRTSETCQEELDFLQSKLSRPVVAFSKHGSGQTRYGRHHYAPYEFEKYIDWGRQAGMKLFFGNLEDPQIMPVQHDDLLCFPAAFWLEPHWRDTKAYPIEWLLTEARRRDVVMLLHPDNVTASPEIMREFQLALRSIETTLSPTLTASFPDGRGSGRDHGQVTSELN